MIRLQLIGDDIAAVYLREMLLNPGSVAQVVSDDDAVVFAEATEARSPHPRRLRVYGKFAPAPPDQTR